MKRLCGFTIYPSLAITYNDYACWIFAFNWTKIPPSIFFAKKKVPSDLSLVLIIKVNSLSPRWLFGLWLQRVITRSLKDIRMWIEEEKCFTLAKHHSFNISRFVICSCDRNTISLQVSHSVESCGTNSFSFFFFLLLVLFVNSSFLLCYITNEKVAILKVDRGGGCFYVMHNP